MEPLAFKIDSEIGEGAFSVVCSATEKDSGIIVAVKKSRVSLRVKRTMLRHEARVLQLLQGHPAIPKLFGYQRLQHFEYIAIDLLGRDMNEICKRGHALKVGTVACIAEQMLSALEHLNAHGIVHRDIKPGNILHRPDLSRVCLIDFGIARKLTPADAEPKSRYESNQAIVGTLDWCSINTHLGFDLRPYDDLESLAYTLLYLVMGDLPWRLSARRVTNKQAMKYVLAAKQAFTGSEILADNSIEFRALLDFARKAKGDIMGNLTKMQVTMHNLASPLGNAENEPLDFTLVDAVSTQGKVEFIPGSESDSGGVEPDEEPNEEYSNSYVAMDVDRWDMRAGRGKSLTLPQDEAGLLDAHIPDIIVTDKLYKNLK